MTPPVLPPMRARRANAHEFAFQQFAQTHGIKLLSRGWPDFLGWTPEGQLIAIEVKPLSVKNGGLRYLKREQSIVMRALIHAGIPCYLSDGHSLIPYDSSRHDLPVFRQ